MGLKGLPEGSVEKIRSLYETGVYSQRNLAEMYGVVRSTIQKVLNPELGKSYRQNNKEKCAQATARWKQSHPEYNEVRATRERDKRRDNPAYAASQRETARQWRSNNLTRTMHNSAKNNSVARGLEFSIEISDITVPETCPVYGFLLDTRSGKRNDRSASLDRVNNDKGYIPGNVVVISWKANRDKRSLSYSQVLSLASYMGTHRQLHPELY